MKKLFVCTLCLATTLFALGQTGTKPKPATTTKPAAKPVLPPSAALKTITDSTSYAIGVSVASFYKEQGIKNINTAALSAAVKDVLAGKKLVMDEALCNSVMNKVMSSVQENKSQPNIDSGLAFLELNKKRPGVNTTASGLQYEVVKEGTGIKPGPTDSVTCNYKGTLINGTEFDNSYKRGEPITFPLNRVIPGWTEALQLMSVGSTYKFYIPYTLAYGAYDNGPIPGGSTLLFQIDLLDVKKAQ
jgi:FKBP-type peptidyl-prolyl cis-trans isomerase